MAVQEHVRASDASRDHMSFELQILEDAQQQADVYWSNWLWCRPQPAFTVSRTVIERLAARWGAEAVSEEWRRCFDVLTSWDYVDALMGRDVRRLLAEFDHCP